MVEVINGVGRELQCGRADTPIADITILDRTANRDQNIQQR
jgi:hypothetical protein